MNICVHTAPGRRGATDPRVFFVGGHRLIVASIIDRWVQQPHRFFEVICDDGRHFLLRHDTERRTWELAGVYRSASPRPSAPQPGPVQWLMSRSLFWRKQKPVV